jgi:glucosyl-dolichyl phosphate glucuronosyltransferase
MTRFDAPQGLGAHVSETMNSAPPVGDGSAEVSIIVCTHNRADMLEGCIRSILADPSERSRELIVVDNGSTDGTERLVRDLASTEKELAIRYEFEGRIGKAHALNRGVSCARGALLVFTDDDVLVEPGWVDSLCEPFSDPAVVATGGRIVPEWPFEPPAWMLGPHADHVAGCDWGPEPRMHDPSHDELPCGANMAARSELARQYDPPFPTALGPGRIRTQYEEFVFGQRLAVKGKIPYAPGAIVRHRVQPERVDWVWMRKAYLQAGFGHVRFERISGRPIPSLPRRLVHAVKALGHLLAVRRENGRLAELGPDQAWQEFGAYADAGKKLESLLGRYPRVADWVAFRLG